MRYKKGILLTFYILHVADSIGQQCLVSLPTVQTVTSCPTNTAELSQARKRKQCIHLSIIQNCTTPGNFQYHCVLNTYENETVEVCAPIILSQGYCLKFDEGGARLQNIYDRECTIYSKPCTTRFNSSELLQYFQCNYILNKSKQTNSVVNTTKEMPPKTENCDIVIERYIIGFVVALNSIALFAKIVYEIRHRKTKATTNGKEKRSLDNSQDQEMGASLVSESTKEDNTNMLFKAIGKFANDELKNTLGKQDIDCVETFCSLTESDFKEMGLSIGQRKKCVKAAHHIQNYELQLQS